MDTPALPLGYFDEGARYLAAVERHGLRPAAFLWAFDRVTEGFVLVLITDEFDAVRPLAVSKILFKAYNAQVTPRAIDPFVIRLHSPQHQIVREMETLPIGLKAGTDVFKNREPGPFARTTGSSVTHIGGLQINGDWVYRFNKPLAPAKAVDVLRGWRRFERNIDKVAA